jgi:Nif-specific regulatory protein
MPSQKKYIRNYRILEKIDETNYAQIYKIVDSKNNIRVLKIARAAQPLNNDIITREFSTLAQIKHPNIVEVYDYDINDDGRAYFTLEYINGKPINKSFHEYSREFAAAIMQVIGALAVLRNRGIVYGDLKPENILFDTSTKRTVLIDFGFAHAVGKPVLQAGTIGYLSPEIAKGSLIDQKGDIYSLGVIIQEVVSGKKYNGSFESLEDITEDLNKLLYRTLSVDPLVRPTIAEIHQAIKSNMTSAANESIYFKPSLPRLAFVEITGIAHHLNEARGIAIVIYGDTGMGKTRTLQEIKHRLLVKDYYVLHYAPTENTNLFHAIQSFIGNGQYFDEPVHKFQIFEDITQRILTMAKNQRVAIMIDDLHTFSDYDLELVRYLGYSVQKSNVALITTSKPRVNITNLQFKAINLRPLTSEETKKLLYLTFADTKPHQGEKSSICNADFVHWLKQESGGNPLYVSEILQKLYNDGIIYFDDNKWHINTRELKNASTPRSLENLVTHRIQQIDRNELKILKLLHLAEYPLNISIISSTLGISVDEGIEVLKSLDLIREENHGHNRLFYIANEIITQALRNRISRRERIVAYRNLISVLEHNEIQSSEYYPILAKSYSAIGNKSEACKYYERAAEMAERTYDYQSALALYTRLIKQYKFQHNKNHYGYLLKIADIYQTIGELNLSIDYYKRVIRSKNRRISATAHAGLGKACATSGQYEIAYGHLKKAMASTEFGTAQYIFTANRLGYILANLSRFKDAEDVLCASLELAVKLEAREPEADTLYYLATLEWYRNNYHQGIEKTKRLLALCSKHHLPKQYAFCTSLLGSLYQQTRRLNSAQYYFSESIRVFTEIKRLDGLSAALHNSGLLLVQQGRIIEAIHLFEESLGIAERTNNKSIYLASIVNLALINSDFGNYQKATELYQMALTIEPTNVWANYGLAMIFVKRKQILKARALLLRRRRAKKVILYNIGLAFIDSAIDKVVHTNQLSKEEIEIMNNGQKSEISVKIESLMKLAQLYYERQNFEKSLKYANVVFGITNPSSREYCIARILVEINAYISRTIDKIDIEPECSRLKEMGCIYDYAYVTRLKVEATLNRGLKQGEVRQVVEELNRAQEIFESLGAELELSKLRAIQGRFFPLIAEDYSRRVISEQYLQTFSGIAELISSNLGDEHFVQSILDLVIKATNAERGALFIKTPKGMDFIAGRDMDQTTIKDASELSRTAIKQMEKGKILFAQDALSDPTFNIKRSVMLNQIHSLLCIPLSVAGNVIGAIYLDSRITSGIFGPQDKDFLMTISKILASVIEKSIAFRSMSEENILLKANIIKEIGSGHLMGKSRVMKEVYRLIDSVAETNSPVLILGETGTGKGMIARLIHLQSQRKSKKFLSINCGTIPETLLESELFGHKKGAFTGAISDKKGLLEGGEGGTVFLDEITNTSLEFQGKLLEAIEEKIIRRVGETTTRNIDVRFLFATNRDLEVEVEDSRFRRDLFYRINVFKIEVPPLRDRASDIPLLGQFFLERYTKEINKKIDGFSAEAMQRLKEYLWPGNVRELQNVIERAVVLAKGNLINLKDIGFEKTKTAEVMPLKEIKKEAVIEALNIANWNITKAAKMLSIGRRSLHRYIKKFDIVNDSTLSIGRKK